MRWTILLSDKRAESSQVCYLPYILNNNRSRIQAQQLTRRPIDMSYGII